MISNNCQLSFAKLEKGEVKMEPKQEKGNDMEKETEVKLIYGKNSVIEALTSGADLDTLYLHSCFYFQHFCNELETGRNGCNSLPE